MTIIKKTRNASVSEAVEKRYTVGRNVNCCSHYRKHYVEVPQKIKNRTPYNLVILFLCI